ncbi:MAG: hypothetical protein ACI81P_001809 [Neolewinella sp.]|jgi:hypothetical protein
MKFSLSVITLLYFSSVLFSQQKRSDINRPLLDYNCSQKIIQVAQDGINEIVKVESAIFVYLSYDSLTQTVEVISYSAFFNEKAGSGVRDSLDKFLMTDVSSVEVVNTCDFNDQEIFVLPIVMKNAHVDIWTAIQYNPIRDNFRARRFYAFLRATLKKNVLPIYYLKRSNKVFFGR